MDEQAKLRVALKRTRIAIQTRTPTPGMSREEHEAEWLMICAAAEATLPKAVEPEPRDIDWAVQEVHDFNASGGMPASVRTALHILVEHVKGGRSAPAAEQVNGTKGDGRKTGEPAQHGLAWALRYAYERSATTADVTLATALCLLADHASGKHATPAPASREVPCWEVRATSLENGGPAVLNVEVSETEISATACADSFRDAGCWTCIEVRQSTHRVPA